MARRIISRPGLGGYTRYYEDGKYIGKSRPGLLPDTEVFFDAEGKRIGTSRPGLFDTQHIVLEEELDPSPKEPPADQPSTATGCLCCVFLLVMALLLFHACGNII